MSTTPLEEPRLLWPLSSELTLPESSSLLFGASFFFMSRGDMGLSWLRLLLFPRLPRWVRPLCCCSLLTSMVIFLLSEAVLSALTLAVAAFVEEENSLCATFAELDLRETTAEETIEVVALLVGVLNVEDASRAAALGVLAQSEEWERPFTILLRTPAGRA